MSSDVELVLDIELCVRPGYMPVELVSEGEDPCLTR